MFESIDVLHTPVLLQLCLKWDHGWGGPDHNFTKNIPEMGALELDNNLIYRSVSVNERFLSKVYSNNSIIFQEYYYFHYIYNSQ